VDVPPTEGHLGALRSFLESLDTLLQRDVIGMELDTNTIPSLTNLRDELQGFGVAWGRQDLTRAASLLGDAIHVLRTREIDRAIDLLRQAISVIGQ